MGVRESPEGASECGACCQQVTRQSVSEAVSAPQGRKGQKEMQAPQFSSEASLSLMGTLSYPIVCLPKTSPFPSAPSGHSCASPQGPLISPFPPPSPPSQSAPLSRNGFPTHFPAASWKLHLSVPQSLHGVSCGPLRSPQAVDGPACPASCPQPAHLSPLNEPSLQPPIPSSEQPALTEWPLRARGAGNSKTSNSYGAIEAYNT